MKKSQFVNNLCIAIASVGTFLIIGGPILLCLIGSVVLSSCNSEPSKPEEIQLSALSADTEEDRCPFTGDIVGIGNVVGSDEAFGGSGLTMVLVKPDSPDKARYVAAVTHKSDNFSIGDRVDVCLTRILARYRAGGEYESLFITRKRPGQTYGDSESQTSLEKCQEELKKCNEHTSTLIKVMQASKEAE